MDSLMQSARAAQAAPAALRLPAQRIDAAGRAHVDQRAVLALALPLMANSAVQIVLNLTDMWFMGRISTKALAAVGAVQWLVWSWCWCWAGPARRCRRWWRRPSARAATRAPARRCGPRCGRWPAARRCSCWWARRGT